MSILQVENLVHGFGDHTLLKNVSFRLLKGEHIGLIGANGAGKTTFLNILTGMLLPDEGSIQWSPGVCTGYLDQHASLKEGSSVRETLRNAFSSLYAKEVELLQIGQQLQQGNPDEMERLLKRMGQLQDTLENSSCYSIDSHIENVAAGLGIKSLGMETPVQELSGGQRTKLLLGKLLLEAPDILILDEPTNYLDREHIEWLTDYLADYPGSFILVSHDTGFLNKVVNVIYYIEFTQMKRYPGNYEKFLQLSDQKRREYSLQYSRQQAEIARMEDFIRKNIARASTTGRAQSRLKQLGKLERLEKPQTAVKASFQFTSARESDAVVFESLELEIGYSRPLLPKLDVRLNKGDKIAVTGFNGIGKSTLLKTLMGVIPSLGGLLEFGKDLCPAYYEQEAVVKKSINALEEVWSCFPHMTQKEVRQALARCGLKQEHVLQPLSSLSGGEQSKVRLCKLMLRPSNWLLLDEPTNHLDRDARETLGESLAKYTGSILLVCHDVSFYQHWISDVWNLERLRKKK
jgi:ATPase subunit of ABC transporter with duplicated ATPase domains